jgi:hypothetical protein
LVSIDGTDFRLYDPTPFWRGWFSFKFKGPALRYEVGICIQSGDIVWLNGPYPAGAWPDLKIFRDGLKRVLARTRPREKLEADKGYRGEPQYIKTPNDYGLTYLAKEQKKNVRARHETVNKRFKQFGCLLERFRHDKTKHGDAFRAVAVITQLAIENGEPLFDVEYDDRNHYF